MNQIDIKKGVLLTILACKSSQQSVLSLFSLDFVSHLVFFSMCEETWPPLHVAAE